MAITSDVDDAVIGRSGRDTRGACVLLGSGDFDLEGHVPPLTIAGSAAFLRRIVDRLMPLAVQIEAIRAVDAATYLRRRQGRRLSYRPVGIDSVTNCGSSSGRCTACTASTTVHGVSIQCWPDSARPRCAA